MFDPCELQETVALHEKGYELLRWVGKNLRKRVLDFGVVHRAASTFEAAQEWITRHRENLPQSVRPAEHQVVRFAHLFASYLATSFTLDPKPRARVVSYCGCYCSYCTHLGQADRLQVKSPSKRARRSAEELKRIYLRTLARECEFELASEQIDVLLADSELREAIALATYGHELVPRTKYASQGEGVLAIWRQIACNTKGSPIVGFKLSATDILAAQRRIVGQLRNP